jgi:hypothetical protein
MNNRKQKKGSRSRSKTWEFRIPSEVNWKQRGNATRFIVSNPEQTITSDIVTHGYIHFTHPKNIYAAGWALSLTYKQSKKYLVLIKRQPYTAHIDTLKWMKSKFQDPTQTTINKYTLRREENKE